MKPVCETGSIDWLSELPSTIKNCNNTIHHSRKTTPIDGCKKGKKTVFSDLPEKREKRAPKDILGDLVRKAGSKKFSERAIRQTAAMIYKQ